MKATKTQLEKFIKENIKAISPKTGKNIQVNTFGMKKEELIAIIEKVGMVEEFEYSQTTQISQPNKRLEEIGKDLASFWGGNFISWSESKLGITFLINEHGDTFHEIVNWKDLKKDYNFTK